MVGINVGCVASMKPTIGSSASNNDNHSTFQPDAPGSIAKCHYPHESSDHAGRIGHVSTVLPRANAINTPVPHPFICSPLDNLLNSATSHSTTSHSATSHWATSQSATSQSAVSSILSVNRLSGYSQQSRQRSSKWERSLEKSEWW